MKPNDPNWNSTVEAPLCVDDAEDVAWDHEADFVVVGIGAAGAAAALEAREHGLEVIALDRAEGGGATERSGGVFYAGGGTRVQKEVGEEDTPQSMFDYLKLETQGVVRDTTLMRFCTESPETIDWLSGHGVKFSGPVWKEKTSYPAVRYFLYHSDNSLLPRYRSAAKPAARGHRGVISKGKSAVNLGGSIIWPMMKSMQRLGVHLHLKTEVRQLVLSGSGRVLGLRAMQIDAGSPEFKRHGKYLARAERISRVYPVALPGGKLARKLANHYMGKARQIENENRRAVYYRSRRGIALCAGGFIFNRAMVRHHCPKYKKGMPLGTAGDDGSGIRLGESAGGATDRMGRGTAWRFINPPIAWSQGIIVNARGARYVNESCYGATIGEAMVEHNDGIGWLILDSRLVKEAWRQSRPGKVLPFQWQLAALNMLLGKRKAAGVRELSERFGFDFETLSATIDEYNRIARGEAEDPFGKERKEVRGLEPPFHVIDVSLAQRLLPCTVLTMGGLVVDEESGQVLRADRSPVEGLYAAGRTAVGIPSHLYMSGLSIADGVFSGRRAGRHAAAQVSA